MKPKSAWRALFLVLGLVAAVVGLRPVPTPAGLEEAVPTSSGVQTAVFVVLDETAVFFGGTSPSERLVITDDRGEFHDLVVRLENQGLLAGTIVIQSCQPTGVYSEVAQAVGCGGDGGESGGGPSGTVIIYDQATLDEWADAGFTPAFLEGVEADEIPTVNEAVLDIEFDMPAGEDGSRVEGTFRVRKSDGALAVVSATTRASGVGEHPGFMGHRPCHDSSCGAGPWWQACRACCWSQSWFCNTFRTLFPWLGIDCAGCVQRCLDCLSPPRPCHSCDPWGMSWVLCRFVPGGSC